MKEPLDLIHLTTPVGRIAIVTEYIIAVSEVNPHEKGHNNTAVKTKIYASPDGDSYNILEDYDEVMDKLGFIR